MPHSSQESKLDYIEQKYGSSTSHVHLSKSEVEAMVDKALTDSPTVTYLLQSLKQVRRENQSMSNYLSNGWCIFWAQLGP
jgi:hypothetical protein